MEKQIFIEELQPSIRELHNWSRASAKGMRRAHIVLAAKQAGQGALVDGGIGGDMEALVRLLAGVMEGKAFPELQPIFMEAIWRALPTVSSHISNIQQTRHAERVEKQKNGSV
jgi:ABC-type hemin transport system substrate-binding protein